MLKNPKFNICFVKDQIKELSQSLDKRIFQNISSTPTLFPKNCATEKEKVIPGILGVNIQCTIGL